MTLEKLNELTAGVLLYQEPRETLWLCDILEGVKLNNVLEIGVAYGASMRIWEYLLESTGLLVGVDLNGMVNASEHIKPMLEQSQKDVRFVLGDSTAIRTVTAVGIHFCGRPVDFLFIDSNHQYQTTKEEYFAYSPMVRQGGIIAFHDVYQKQVGASVFWQELKEHGGLRTDEYTDGNGMGVVYKPKGDTQ